MKIRFLKKKIIDAQKSKTTFIYYLLFVISLYADTYINVTATTFLLGDIKGILGATEDRTHYSVVD